MIAAVRIDLRAEKESSIPLFLGCQEYHLFHQFLEDPDREHSSKD